MLIGRIIIYLQADLFNILFYSEVTFEAIPLWPRGTISEINLKYCPGGMEMNIFISM